MKWYEKINPFYKAKLYKRCCQASREALAIADGLIKKLERDLEDEKQHNAVLRIEVSELKDRLNGTKKLTIKRRTKRNNKPTERP